MRFVIGVMAYGFPKLAQHANFCDSRASHYAQCYRLEMQTSIRAFARGGALIVLGWLLCSSFAAQPQVLSVRSVFEWAGLSPTWFGYEYTFTCTAANTCTVAGVRWEDTRSNPKKVACQQATKAVDASSAVQDLWRASNINLKAVKEPVQRIDHTDDYPSFEVTITTSGGSSLLKNTSNAFQGGQPWNVQRGGQWFVQQGNRIEAAFKKLMRLVPCEKR
jgi:hypothetical protein